jgi:hypothetical protein
MNNTPEFMTQDHALVDLDNMQDQRDLAMKVLKRLERERDEAIASRKASAADWLLQVENADKRVSEAKKMAARAVQDADRLERERDEAREAFKEMWRSGDAFLPHVDSETINRWRKAAGWEETK